MADARAGDGERTRLLGSKGTKYQSSSALTAATKQRNVQDNLPATINRSHSVGGDMKPSKLNPVQLGRRDLYGSLPFIGVFGMQYTEDTIRRVISRKSFQSLTDLESEKGLAEVDVDEIIVTSPLVFAVLCAMLAEFLVGYNTSVMNAPEAVVFPGHTTAEWSIAVSAFAIGGPFGAILGGKNANVYGRRGAMLINAWIFLFGGLLMTFAPNVYWLIPARFIIGFASGYASVLVPVYLGEIAPPTLRGTLGTCTQFALVIGILASGLAAFPLATPTLWRYLFAGTPILAALQLLCAPLLLESPRWLLSKDPQSREAMVVLKKLRGFRSDEEVQLEVNFMQYAADKHKTRHSSAHSSGAMLDLLGNRSLRLLVACAIGLQVAQQLCGINAVFYYSTTFFTGILDNPMQGTTLVAFVNVLATWVALKMMDKRGRRELVLWSSGGMLLSTSFIILALLGYIPKLAALLAVVAYVSFFEIGLGPIPWLIVAEMFNAKYVATAMSVASQVNWACNFMVGIGFPFMIEYLGPWSFAPFACVLLITFALTMIYLPETHGKTVEEVQRLVVGVDDEVERAIHVIRGVENYDSVHSYYQRGGGGGGDDDGDDDEHGEEGFGVAMERGVGGGGGDRRDALLRN